MVRFVLRTLPDTRGKQNFWALGRSAEGAPIFQSFAGHLLKAHVAQACREGVRVEVVEMLAAHRLAVA